MGLLSEFRYKKQARADYTRCAEEKKSDIKRFEQYANKEWEKYSKLKDAVEKGNFDEKYFSSWNAEYVAKARSNPAVLASSMEEARQKAMHWENSKLKTERDLKYMRPNTKEDIAERQEMYEKFAKAVERLDPQNVLDLRIHATTLSTTEEIINSGGLISSVDRTDGFIESTNLSNEISVGKISEIQYSVDFWMDSTAYTESKPCGCMFIVQPQTAEEAKMISGRQMNNVLFNEHPEQLKAIVTTSENVELVQQWLKDNKLNEDIVFTFDEFPTMMDYMMNEWIPPYSDLTKADIEKYTRDRDMQENNTISTQQFNQEER